MGRKSGGFKLQPQEWNRFSVLSQYSELQRLIHEY